MQSDNVLPLPSVYDGVHVATTNAKHFSQRALKIPPSFKKASKLAHFICGEFGRSDSFSFCMIRAALAKHVLNVIPLRSSKKVIRIAARPIVAMMTHIETFRNWTVRQLPRLSVCNTSTPFLPMRAPNSVAVVSDFPQERPTFIFRRNFNSLPESIRNRPQHQVSPASKSASLSDWKLGNVLVDAFEVHGVGLCSKKGTV